MRKRNKIRRLFIFDFDGTLSDIVADRGDAQLHPENRLLLRKLAAREDTAAAVLSSRALDDILSRVDVPGICIGGASGLEWLIPGKGKTEVPEDIRNKVVRARDSAAAPLAELKACNGIGIEDKFWSIAVHTRGAPERSKQCVEKILRDSPFLNKLEKFRGPEVMEIALAAGMDKAAGARRLCGLLGIDPLRVKIVYAGDDENDARAMRWVLDNGGAAITVGRRPLAEGAPAVGGPGLLAGQILKMLEDTAKA